MRFSICFGSRDRPEMLYKAISCAINTAKNKRNIHIYVYIDNDDPQYAAYKNLEQFFPETVHIYFDRPMVPARILEFLSQEAMKDGTDYIMMASDDLYFRTKDWDVIMMPYLEKFSDNIFCMWFNDLCDQEAFGSHPVIHRRWIETVGFLTHEKLNFFHVDTWIYEIAKKMGRLIYVPEIIAEHYDIHVKKRPMDETSIRIRRDIAPNDLKNYLTLREEMRENIIKLFKIVDMNKEVPFI